MNESEFARNFPSGKVIPDAMWKLFRYQEGMRGTYTGHFRLYDKFNEIPFPIVLRPYFALFGHDADGSTYSFWLYSNFSLEDAPIVNLDFEGINNAILADSFRDFLSLLSLGIPELGYSIQKVKDWERKVTLNNPLIEFRNWLKREFDIDIPVNPQIVVNKARINHPDLNKWLGEKMSI